MAKHRLVILETASIQSYVFRSNRLRENSGASYLVSSLTGDLAKQVARKVCQTDINLAGTRILEATFEQGLPQTNLFVYSGGGNALLMFKTEALAKQFIRMLSKEALVSAPGLRLMFASTELDFAADLKAQVDLGFQTLNANKAAAPFHSARLGMSVTAECASTGLPATAWITAPGEDAGYLASAESYSKWQAGQLANSVLRKVFPAEGFDYPARLEDLAADEYSDIAVVHIDGNEINQTFRQLEARDNEAYLKMLQSYSQALGEVASAALKHAINLLTVAFQDGRFTYETEPVKGKAKELLKMRLVESSSATESNEASYFLPIRPIIFGGDDTTFVCDARVAHALTVSYLSSFETLSKEHSVISALIPQGLTASAGIALVKSHYPFARAYALAEDLTASAKTAYYEEPEEALSWLDWHRVQGDTLAPLSELRDKTFRPGLTLRPVFTSHRPDVFTNDRFRSWQLIDRQLRAFHDQASPLTQSETFSERRSVLKGLFAQSKKDRDAVRAYLRQKKLTLPKVWLDTEPLSSDEAASIGYHLRSNHNLFFDALELLDHYAPLEQEPQALLAELYGVSP